LNNPAETAEHIKCFFFFNICCKNHSFTYCRQN